MNDTQTTITLPAGIVWSDGGKLGVAIMQGVTCCNDLSPKELFGVPAHDCDWSAPQVWAQYDKPCETCEADYRAMRTRETHQCSGRQVWTVRWPCSECHPFSGDPADGGRCQTCGIKYHCWRCNHPCYMMGTGHGVGKCEPCCDHGYLSARATIQVVPVVEGTNQEWLTYDHLMTHSTEALLWSRTGNPLMPYVAEHLPLPDRLPVPGRDYAVIVRLA